MSEQKFTEDESMCFIEDGVTVKLMTGGDQLDPWFEKERRDEPWLRGFPFNQP